MFRKGPFSGIRRRAKIINLGTTPTPINSQSSTTPELENNIVFWQNRWLFSKPSIWGLMIFQPSIESNFFTGVDGKKYGFSIKNQLNQWKGHVGVQLFSRVWWFLFVNRAPTPEKKKRYDNRGVDPLHMYIYIHIYIRIHTYTYTSTYTYTCTYTYTYTCTYTYTYLYIHTFILMHICVHVFIHTYIHTHIYLYMYM